MGDGLVGDLGGEVVGRDHERTTFATIAGFTDANCLNVSGDGEGFGTTATATRRASTGTTSGGKGRATATSTATATTTATAASCWRGTGGHCRCR
jgi:hypothetical protein